MYKRRWLLRPIGPSETVRHKWSDQRLPGRAVAADSEVMDGPPSLSERRSISAAVPHTSKRSPLSDVTVSSSVDVSRGIT